MPHRALKIRRIELGVKRRRFDRQIDPGGVAPVQARIAFPQGRPVILSLFQPFEQTHIVLGIGVSLLLADCRLAEHIQREGETPAPEFFDVLDPILREYQPDLIIVATGFDMYFADPIGNCNLTSIAYFNFAERILKIAEELCEGRIAFILEGGYSLIGLPFCVHAIIKALLKEKHNRLSFENLEFSSESKREEISKIKNLLINLLKDHWPL